ncbi:MAG: aldo/keto reductase [Caldilineaceae bacterium]|nr:aldo/keto reductase [Caldilineaceae bacterium]
MHYRPLGNTGVSVSEIGMGCNRLGESAMPDAHWIALVHAAIDLGVTLFDSSESYGWGRSEEILGQAVGNRDDVLVATKVSRIQATNEKDFSARRIIEQVEGSLRRLRRDCIDIFQLHSPSLEDMQRFDWPEAMTKLRDAGKLRLSGVSINNAASGQWLLDQGLAQVFQVSYNLLAPETGQAVFAAAAEKGVGIMVRVPMAQGILTGKFQPGQPVAEGHRAHMAGQQMERLIAEAAEFQLVAQGAALPMSQFALRYAISPTAVSAVIPGARNVEQLTNNVAASNGRGLDATELAAVAAIQQRLAEQR